MRSQRVFFFYLIVLLLFIIILQLNELINKNTVTVKENNDIKVKMRKTSNYTPFIEEFLFNKDYHSTMSISKKQFIAFIEAILELEVGNETRFVPKNLHHKYREVGDNGNASHAFQLDRRYHPWAFKTKLSFAQAFEYAYKQQILPCYFIAKNSKVKAVLTATARCYNGGSNAIYDDSKTTKNYGARFQRAYLEYLGK